MQLNKIIITVLAISLLPVMVVSAGTITVDDNGGADYTSIQDAVNAASPEDVIVVKPGTYTENINVNIENLTIKSESGNPEDTVVRSLSSWDDVFYISSNFVRIEGLSVVGDGNDYSSGIKIDGASNCCLVNNVVSSSDFGIYLYFSSNNKVTENTASNNTNNGICLDYSSNNMLIGNTALSNECGISLCSSSNNTLKDNTASNNSNSGLDLLDSSNNILTGNIASNNIDDGIYLGSSNNNMLIGNTALSNECGIFLWDSINNTLTDNIVSNNGDGISLDDSSSNMLAGNIVSNNLYGISLGYSSNNMLTGNTVSNNSYNGIYLVSSSYNTFTANIASKNRDYAIYLESSSNNRIIENFFDTLYNNVHFETNDNNIWNSSTAGNYWSSPDEVGFSQTHEDEDGNGICDESYILNENNVDYLPLSIWIDEGSNEGPVAAIISISPNPTNESETVTFTGFGSNSDSGIVGYEWISNIDGYLSSSAIFRTSNLSAGTHTISLSVQDDEGIWSEVVTETIAIKTIDESSPITLTVDDNGDANYTSIQKAVNAAHPGDIIVVKPGIYTENINVNVKNLTIKSESGNPEDTVVKALFSSDNVFCITEDFVHIEGLSAVGANAYPYSGIKIQGASNCCLINNTASKNYYGISLKYASNNNTLIGNTASKNNNGIYFYNSSDNILAGNTASDNIDGIELSFSSKNNTLVENRMLNNNYNFACGNSINDIDISNIVNEKPVYYIVGESNLEIDKSTNAGVVYCINCENISITELILSNNRNGIYFYNTSNSFIENNVASNNSYGIELWDSGNNTLSDNTAYNNEWDGICLFSSSYNTLSNNTAYNNEWGGICLFSSSYNTLAGNTVSYNKVWGIDLCYSSHNTLTSNIVTDNGWDGIYVQDSSEITLTDNTVYNNEFYGIYLKSSSNNMLDSNDVSYNNGVGIKMGDSNNNTLTCNTASYNEEGIILYDFSNSMLTGNTASYNNEDGISLSGSDIMLTSNIVTDNGWNGICLYDSSHNTLTDNTASNNGNGISLSHSSNSMLTGNTVLSNDCGIDLSSSIENTLISNTISNNCKGIDLYNSSHNTLTDNTASKNSDDGIRLRYSNHNTLTDNIVSDNSCKGISLSFSIENTLTSNLASNNYRGIDLYDSSHNALTDNTASDNSDDGIRLLRYSNMNTLNNNIVCSNIDDGIYLEDSSNNTICSNTVSNNDCGISLSHSSKNRIVENFFNNLYNNVRFNNFYFYTNEGNIWNSSTAGNYWATPNGTGFSQTHADSDCDGICDEKYPLNEYETDYLPLALGNGGILFTIHTPVSGEIFFSNLINVSGTASDDVIFVRVNGMNATGTTNWDAEVQLAEGENILTFVAEDAEGNKKTANRQVFYYIDDTCYPLFYYSPKIEVGGTYYGWYKTLPNSNILIDSDYLEYSQPDEEGIFYVAVNTSKLGISSPCALDVSADRVVLIKNEVEEVLKPGIFNFSLNVLPRKYTTSWSAGSSVGGGAGVLLYAKGQKDADFTMSTGNRDTLLVMNRDKSTEKTVGASVGCFEAKAPMVDVNVLNYDAHVSSREIVGSQVSLDYKNADDAQKLEGALYIMTSTLSAAQPLMYIAIDLVSKNLCSDVTTDYYESGVAFEGESGADLFSVGIGSKDHEIGSVDVGIGFAKGGSVKDRTYPVTGYHESLIEHIYDARCGVSGSVLGNDIIQWGPTDSLDSTVILGEDTKGNVYGKLKVKDSERSFGLSYVTKEITYDHGQITDEHLIRSFKGKIIPTSTIFNTIVEKSKDMDAGDITVCESRGFQIDRELPLDVNILSVKVSLVGGVHMKSSNDYLINRSMVLNKRPYPLESYSYDGYVQPPAENLGYIVVSLLEPVGDILENSLKAVKETAEAAKEICFSKGKILFSPDTSFQITDYHVPVVESGVYSTVSAISPDQSPEITISTFVSEDPSDQTVQVFSSMGLASSYTTSLSGGDFIVGEITDLQPYNLSFTPAAKLTLNYSEEDTLWNNETELSIYRWDDVNHSWLQFSSELNTDENEVATNITCFGTYAIGYDATEPSIEWNKSDLYKNNISVEASITDSSSGVNLSSIKLTMDGQEQNFTYSIFSGLLRAELNASSGNHTIGIYVADTSGNAESLETFANVIQAVEVTNLQLNCNDSDSVELSWVCYSGTYPVEYYQIYKDWELLTNITQTNFSINGSEPSTYFVIPIDSQGNVGVGGSISYSLSQLVPSFNYDWENSLYPTVGKPVFFDASKSYVINGSIGTAITSYTWVFDGDASTVSGPAINHTFPEPGLHKVTLQIEDSRENEASLTKIINVTNPTGETVDWNPWDDPESEGGELITTFELQEAIYCWLNDFPAPCTGLEITTNRIQSVIAVWLSS